MPEYLCLHGGQPPCFRVPYFLDQKVLLGPHGPDPGPRFRPDAWVLGIDATLALDLQVLATMRSLVELASPSLRGEFNAGLRAATAMVAKQLPQGMSLQVEPESAYAA